MAGLGGGVVILGVGDLPGCVLQYTHTGHPPQWPSSQPGGQSVADLVDREAFRSGRGPIVAGVSVGKKSSPVLSFVPRLSTAPAFCSDTSD